jgi:hypothetical protein
MIPARRGIAAQWIQDGADMPVGDPGGQFNSDWPGHPNHAMYPNGFRLKAERGRVPSTAVKITVSDEAGDLFRFTVKRDGRCYIERRADTHPPLTPDAGAVAPQETSRRLRGGHTFPPARIARERVSRTSSLNLNPDAGDSKDRP